MAEHEKPVRSHLHPLAGTRVLDFGSDLVAYAGRVLADLGAEVILVEPLEGCPMRSRAPMLSGPAGVVSPHFAYAAAGKRSITLDVESDASGELLERILRSSDVALISDEGTSTEHSRISANALNDGRLVVTSVLPYGLTGPRRRWKGGDLTAWAASGAAAMMGDKDRPPLVPGGEIGLAAGGLTAVAGTVLALMARTRDGLGQLVDISLQEAVLSVSMGTGPLFPLEGGDTDRQSHRWAAAQGEYRATDGDVELLIFMPRHWDLLADWISAELNIPEAKLDVFKGPPSVREDFRDLIDGWIEQLVSSYSRADFVSLAQARGIPCTPLNEPSELLEDPHLFAPEGLIAADRNRDNGAVQLRSPLLVNQYRADPGPIPSLGEFNDALYGELGYSMTELALLRSAHVI